jgi:hypothetical protein
MAGLVPAISIRNVPECRSRLIIASFSEASSPEAPSWIASSLALIAMTIGAS